MRPECRELKAESLLDVDQLDVEDERGVWGYRRAGAARAVAEIRRDDQRARSADLHAGDPLIPSANDLAGAEAERERLLAVAGAVEFLAVPIRRFRVVEPAGVMHRDTRARLCLRAVPGLRIS